MKRIFLGISLAIAALASTAATLSPVQLLNPAGSTAGQAIVSTGPSTAPAWGAVTATALGPIAANTVIANTTAASAAPTAAALPSCSTANSALKYTSGTGLSCGTTFALTSGNLSQFAATTSAQLAGVLSDETGTGLAVFSASPTFTGTVAVAAISATGAITPSQTAGIVGTTTNNSVNAGGVGEYIQANATVTNITSGAAFNCTSAALTAGDWDVSGNVYFSVNSVSLTAAVVGINTTSATLPASTFFRGQNGNIAVASGGAWTTPAPEQRISLAAPATVFLVALGSTGGSVDTLCYIRARRAR